MSRLPGVILAGGRARRMGGGDKSLLELGGQSVLAHVIKRLSPQIGALALNANGDPARFAGFSLPVLTDPVPDFAGPLAGILAALTWADGLGAEQVITVAADTPFFPTDFVRHLQSTAARENTPITLAAVADADRGMLRQPTFGLWSVDLRHDLARALDDGTRKIVAWAGRHGAASATFDAQKFDPFFNINTPDDLAQAHILAKAGTI